MVLCQQRHGADDVDDGGHGSAVQRAVAVLLRARHAQLRLHLARRRVHAHHLQTAQAAVEATRVALERAQQRL